MAMEEEIKQVFSDVLRVESQSVHAALTPAELERWDSLQHLNLLLALEDTFAVRFSVDEMKQMFSSFGAILKVVARKLQEA
jgi:acyl carrier protein